MWYVIKETWNDRIRGHPNITWHFFGLFQTPYSRVSFGDTGSEPPSPVWHEKLYYRYCPEIEFFSLEKMLRYRLANPLPLPCDIGDTIPDPLKSVIIKKKNLDSGPIGLGWHSWMGCRCGNHVHLLIVYLLKFGLWAKTSARAPLI